MKVSELLSVLQKVQQVAGDVPVIARDIEHEVETAVHTVGIKIDPAGADGAGCVTLEHYKTPQTPAATPAVESAGAPADQA